MNEGGMKEKGCMMEPSGFCWRGRHEMNAPSSTLMSTFASGLRAMTAMFFRFSKAKVDDLLLHHPFQASDHDVLKKTEATHLTRSKTETLFPTGLKTEFPSGVNTTLPWR